LRSEGHGILLAAILLIVLYCDHTHGIHAEDSVLTPAGKPILTRPDRLHCQIRSVMIVADFLKLALVSLLSSFANDSHPVQPHTFT
jgi:hypothetical protein